MASSSKILKTLENRNIAISAHELNLAILYSTIDSIYFRKDAGKLSMGEAKMAVDEAIKRFQKYENPETPENDDII